jgi:hypothetical protein
VATAPTAPTASIGRLQGWTDDVSRHVMAHGVSSREELLPLSLFLTLESLRSRVPPVRVPSPEPPPRLYEDFSPVHLYPTDSAWGSRRGRPVVRRTPVVQEYLPGEEGPSVLNLDCPRAIRIVFGLQAFIYLPLGFNWAGRSPRPTNGFLHLRCVPDCGPPAGLDEACPPCRAVPRWQGAKQVETCSARLRLPLRRVTHVQVLASSGGGAADALSPCLAAFRRRFSWVSVPTA